MQREGVDGPAVAPAATRDAPAAAPALPALGGPAAVTALQRAVGNRRMAAVLRDARAAPRIRALQRRTIRESYATAGRATGPVWDVSLVVTGAPERSTEAVQDFVDACMDGIRDASASIGPGDAVRSHAMRVTIPYRAGLDHGTVSSDAFTRARGSVLVPAAAPAPPTATTPATTTPGVITLPEITVEGTVCSCDPATRTAYRAETFTFIHSLTPLLDSVVPAGDRLAVAGAIADEYETRQGIRTVVDGLQDAVVGSIPESWIRTDMFFDFHSKLLNTLENDVGPANIKVRTALELVRSGELAVPGSPPSDERVERIVAFLLTERGTVTAAAAVIARAHTRFDAVLPDLGDELSQAVLVEYFKQGESYSTRFAAQRAAHPSHRPCPGDGGCRFWHNIDRLRTEIGAAAP